MPEAVQRQFWNRRPVFVTGHTGFKGAWLTAWLDRMGACVTGYSLAPDTRPSLFELASSRLGRSVIGDICDGNALATALAQAKPEIVFHFAAQSLVRRSYADPVDTFRTNVMGTVILLEALRTVPSVRAVVVVTSDKCYANEEAGLPFREGDPLGGDDPYSSSKACCELVTTAYRASFFSSGRSGCAIASARAGNVIGGGDWSADRLIPDMVRARSTGQRLAIRSPEAIRPWQHVLEPLHGYLLLAQALAGDADRETFSRAWNFGPSEDGCVSVGEIVNRLCPMLQVGWDRVPAPGMKESRTLRIDASLAQQRLGWFPRLSIVKALDWTAEWYLAVERGSDPLATMECQIAAFERLQPDGFA